MIEKLQLTVAVEVGVGAVVVCWIVVVLVEHFGLGDHLMQLIDFGYFWALPPLDKMFAGLGLTRRSSTLLVASSRFDAGIAPQLLQAAPGRDVCTAIKLAGAGTVVLVEEMLVSVTVAVAVLVVVVVSKSISCRKLVKHIAH